MQKNITIDVGHASGTSHPYTFTPWPHILFDPGRDGFIIRDENGTPQFCPIGPWRHEFIDFLKVNGLRSLVLNRSLGFLDTDISFLRDMQFIDSLHLVLFKDMADVHSLSGLRFLEVVASREASLDLTAFPRLRGLVLDDMPRLQSLNSCHSLTYLFLFYYKNKTLHQLASIKNLKSLRIGNCPAASLDGIGELTGLQSLQVHRFRNLSSINALRGMEKLDHLELIGCRKISTLTPIERLQRLEHLDFSGLGELPNISLLRGLPRLRTVIFDGSTIVADGDMSPLLDLPNLKRVYFKNRKWYSHTLREIESELEKRTADGRDRT